VPKNLAEIIDSPTAEIHLLARDLRLAPAVRYYANVLSFYLQGDIERLRETQSRLSEFVEATSPLYEILTALTELRLRMRERRLRREYLESFPSAFDGPLAAEREFCLGLAWEQLEFHGAAAQHHQRAAALYQTHGCPKKSLRALYNVIAAESRVYPHKNFVADCQNVIERSRSLGESSFEGMALTMLSREYQVIGHSAQALEMARRSIKCLENERGSSHYFHAVLHLAHLCIEENNLREAELLLKEAELAPFREAQAARQLLLASIHAEHHWDSSLEASLLPTWRNRLPGLLSRLKGSISEGSARSSQLEERLLKLAYNGPIEKWDLIAKLYPDSVSQLVLENRFKNLLARVRKKYPGRVQCVEGRYHLEKIPGELLL